MTFSYAAPEFLNLAERRILYVIFNGSSNFVNITPPRNNIASVPFVTVATNLSSVSNGITENRKDLLVI